METIEFSQKKGIIPEEMLNMTEADTDGFNWIYDPLAGRKMKVIQRTMDKDFHWVYVLSFSREPE
jgi:hypothetical protein